MTLSQKLVLVFALLTGSHGFAAPSQKFNPESPIDTPIDSFELATQFVDANYPPNSSLENGGRPVVTVYHVGNEIPDQVKWMAMMIDQRGYKVDLQLITFAEALEKSYQRSDALHKIVAARYGAITDSDADLRQRLRYLFGVPGGFTLWPKVTQSKDSKNDEIKSALRQMLIGGLSLTVSFYFSHSHPGLARALVPAVVGSAWIGFNFLFNTQLTEFFNQGMHVEPKKKGGGFAVGRSKLLNKFTIYGRSIITNSLILSSAMAVGISPRFDWFPAPSYLIAPLAIVTNSFISLFSRFFFEEWIGSKKATVLQSGEVVVEEGQFSPKFATRLREFFETGNGLAKNGDLVGIPMAKWVFWGMGVVGIIKSAQAARLDHGLAQAAMQQSTAFDSGECFSLFSVPKEAQ